MKKLRIKLLGQNLATAFLGLLLFLICAVPGLSPAYAEIGNDAISGDITVEIDNLSGGQTDIADNEPVQATLAETSDFMPFVFASAILAAVTLTWVALYSRQKSLVSGAQHGSVFNKAMLKKFGIVLLTASVLLSLTFANRFAIADNEAANSDDILEESNIALVFARIVCDDFGNVEEAELDITNKLDADLQIDDVVSFGELSNIIDGQVDLNIVLAARESVHKTWSTENKIDESVLQAIRDAGGIYHASMNCNVKYNGFHAQFMKNDGTDDLIVDQFVPENHFAKLPGNNPSRAEFRFVEWNTSADGSGDTVDDAYLTSTKVVANVKYFAIWHDLQAFMAEKSSDIELPYKIYSGQDTTTRIISIDEVKQAADNIRAGVAVDNDIFSDLNDKWHLFVKVAGDGSAVNDWIEMRIINVGNHDNDGSAITFQTTHALKDAYAFDASYNDPTLATPYTGNWHSSDLRYALNERWYNELPDSIKTNLVEVIKLYNKTAGEKPNGGTASPTGDHVWALSFTEYIDITGTGNEWWTEPTHLGSTYNFYASKHFKTGGAPDPDSEQAQIIGGLNKKRNGYEATGMYGWQRSLSPNKKTDVLLIYDSGNVSSYYGAPPSNRFYVAPSFAF